MVKLVGIPCHTRMNPIQHPTPRNCQTLACSALTCNAFFRVCILVNMFIICFDLDRLDSGGFIGIGKMHWNDDKHKISWDTHHIHESHTSTSKWRWFFQHPERIYPFGGNGETPDAFVGKRKMHPDVRQKFARYRMLFSQKSKCTEVWIG